MECEPFYVWTTSETKPTPLQLWEIQIFAVGVSSLPQLVSEIGHTDKNPQVRRYVKYDLPSKFL